MTDAAAMTSPLPRYPAYQDSGVPWLGRVPAHWEVVRLKWACSIDEEKLSEGTSPDVEIRYVEVGSVNGRGKIENVETMTFDRAPSRARRPVAEGDTIISTVRTYLRAIAFIEGDNENLVVSTGFSVLRPNEGMVPRFLWRAVQAEPFVQTVVSHSEGIAYPAISPQKLAGIALPLPPLPEQRAIAAYLDEQTARLDALVGRHRRLIALLGERRAALITHAVTKGLDPAAPLRDSGVPWLGQVPAHWEVVRLKQACTIDDDKLTEDTPPDVEIRYVDVGSVNGRGEIEQVQDMTFDRAPSRARRLVTAGDTIISTVRTYLRAIAFLDGWSHGLVVSTGFSVLRPCEEVAPKFLWRAVQGEGFVQAVVAHSEGIAYPAISPQDLADIRLPLPPLAEQHAIAAYLDEQTARLDGLVERAQRMIALLEEYRDALITAAVTGQVDIRPTMATMPGVTDRCLARVRGSSPARRER